MRVVAFGTSSGRPTPTRHVSGLGVDLGRSWILVDCGEGTQQQIMRSPLKLSRLAAILITHLHGDHVLGLPGLLGTMGMEGRTAPLQIVGTDGLGRWLDSTCDLPILGIDFPTTITELVDDTLEGVAGDPMPVADVDGFGISALPLRHRVPCFGYRITEPVRAGHLDVEHARALGVPDGPMLGQLQRGEDVVVTDADRTDRVVRSTDVVGPEQPGRVITVLGDTTRCEASVSLARDADLLVHECTYAARDAALAEQWKHSTSLDAASVALDARARRLLLTHVSTRYDDLDELVDEARTVFPETTRAVELETIEVDRPAP